MTDIPEEQFAAWSRRLQASDRTACRELFHKMYASLLRFAWGMTGHEAAAQDVVQEAFIRLWKRRSHLDPKRSLRSLLYVSVRNLALDYERGEQRRLRLAKSVESSASMVTPDEHIGAEQLAKNLQGWIRNLPARRREAFLLSRLEGLSYQEIGRMMGVTPKTVENHIHLALQQLRQHLRDYDPDRMAS